MKDIWEHNGLSGRSSECVNGHLGGCVVERANGRLGGRVGGRLGANGHLGGRASERLGERSRTFVRKFVLVFLAVALVVSTCVLTSCKKSYVLTERIENPELGQLDETIEPMYKHNPDAPEDSTKIAAVSSDTDSINNQKQTDATFDEQQENEQDTDQRENDVTPNNLNATTGTEASDKQGDNEQAGDGEGNTQNPTGSGDDSQQSGETEDSQKQSGDGPADPSVPATGGRGGSAQIYDASGANTVLPDAQKIVACGQYATIVQMLCGTRDASTDDRCLVGCDPAWKARVSAKGAFPGEGIETLPTPVKEYSEGSYKIDVNAVINNTAADVVICDGSELMVSTDEQAQLQEAGISVVIMPTLNTVDTQDDNIVTAVNSVAEMLKTSPYYAKDPTTQANNYKIVHDGTRDACTQANGGYSVHIANGSSQEYIYQLSGDGTQTGKSLPGSPVDTKKNKNTAYIDSWLSMSQSISASEVRNHFRVEETTLNITGVGQSVLINRNGFPLMDYYMQMSGVVDNSLNNMTPAFSDSGQDRSFAIIPGDATKLKDGGSVWGFRSGYALWFWKYADTDNWILLGDEEFPGIFTKDSTIAEHVLSSAADSKGLYNVGQQYKVYVMPTGVSGSWARGTVESFLFAPYAYYLFHESSQNLQWLTEKVEQFYETFYRVDGSATTGMIDNWLDVRTAG